MPHGKWEQLIEYKFSTFLFQPRQYQLVPFMRPSPIVHLIEIISASTWFRTVELTEGQSDNGRGFKKKKTSVKFTACILCLVPSSHFFLIKSLKLCGSVLVLHLWSPEESSRESFASMILASAKFMFFYLEQLLVKTHSMIYRTNFSWLFIQLIESLHFCSNAHFFIF